MHLFKNSGNFPKRSTAYKLNIEEIVKGKFFQEENEDRKITYIQTQLGLKVNIFCVLGDVNFKSQKAA